MADIAPSVDATPARAVSSLAVLGLITAIYQLGMLSLCRQSILLEAVISLGLPLFCLAAGWMRFQHPRLMQLLAIESFFNVLAVVSRLALDRGYGGLNRLVAAGFAVFFLFQLGGFIAYQVKLRKPHGVAQSLAAALLIGGWWLGIANTANTTDTAGRLLMWGQNAPLAVQLFYVVWVFNVMMVDSQNLPWLRTATVHAVSVAIAVWSGEFFHARLLTACHLFLLDLVFGFGMHAPQALGLDFAVIPHAWIPVFRSHVQPALAWLCSVSAVALLAYAAIAGLDLRW